MLGPGTLEMTRLCTTGWRSDSRSREYIRTADPKTEGAANCAQSVSRLASSALVWSLATTLASRMASRRSTGSSMSVDSDMNIPDTRLVPGRDSAAWTDIGTIAMSGFAGSAFCPSRYLRRAVDVMASTTSLTVVPNAFLTRLMSSRSTLVNEMVRWPVIVRLNGVRGAVNGAGIANPLRARLIQDGSTPRVPGSREASRHGVARRESAPPTASSSAPEPPAVSLTRSASSAGSSGVSVHSCDIILAPVTPSTVEWCILANTATRPSDRPSMTYICHSGIERSIGWLARCAHSSASS